MMNALTFIVILGLYKWQCLGKETDTGYELDFIYDRVYKVCKWI